MYLCVHRRGKDLKVPVPHPQPFLLLQSLSLLPFVPSSRSFSPPLPPPPLGAWEWGLILQSLLSFPILTLVQVGTNIKYTHAKKLNQAHFCIHVNFHNFLSCFTATRSQLTDLATAINNSSVDNPELLTVSTTAGEMDISSNLRLHSTITPEALTSLPPLSTTSTLESVLNEPMMTTASSDTTEPNKIDIIS